MKTIVLIIVLFVFKTIFSQHKDSTYYFYFNVGESTQKADSIVAFEKFFNKFRSCKTCGIKLEGHTDSKGDAKSNQILAMKRINFAKSLIKDTINIKIVEEVIGMKYSQYVKNDDRYRMVKMTIHSPVIIKKPILRIETEPKYAKFAELNKPIKLQVNFNAGKFYLLPESHADLDLLRDYLKSNPQINAHIVGHVCCSDEYLLSKNRALAVYNYLVDRGINKSRLTYAGASNKKPLVEEVNEAAEAMNRRVEISLKLPEDKAYIIETADQSKNSPF